jgi:subtilisin family serine protease
MHKSWRSNLKTLVVLSGAVALLSLVSSGAFAQGQAGTAPGDAKHYVFMSSAATWGDAQNATIARLGGTVDFGHAGSGLGAATSTDPDFLKAAMRSGAFSKGAEDMMVQWQSPVNEQLLTEDSVNPNNDNFIHLQWSMQAIHAFGAWSAGFDGSGVRVAVIDGGMCDLHPDIAPNLDVAHSTSFVPGFAFNQDTGGPTAFRHACHVAGIIAAADNTIGTIGVAPHATIISVKALHGGSGTFAAVIQAILYASDPISAGGGGADIINMSLGALFPRGGGNTGAGQLVAALNQAVNYATAHNVLCVSAAGNAALDLDHSGSFIQVPAQSGSGIAVSATGPEGYAVGWPSGAMDFTDPASYSNFGHSAIWVAAPGGDSRLPGTAVCSIPRVVGPPVTTQCWVFDLVLSPGNQVGSYFFASGTSMAAPHVSGVAALIKQKFPGITVGDLKTRLAQSADQINGDGADSFYGHGFVDAAAAVAGSSQQSAAGPQKQLVTPGARVELTVARNGGSSVPEISFTMPAGGQARVDLFDVAGRKVAVLFNGQANVGVTTLSWSGRDASGRAMHPGAYFARLTANGAQQGKEIVLLGQ